MGIAERNLAALVLACIALAIFASPSTASLPPGADPVVGEWPRWPYPVSCGGAPFDPVSVFSGKADAETGPLPSEAALREILADPALGWLGLNKVGWRLASEDQAGAVFISGLLSGGLERVSLELSNGKWKLAGSGTCTLVSVLHGLPVVSWRLIDEQPVLSKNTKRLRITLDGGPCNSGMPFAVRKPIFRQLGKRLLMTVLVDPPPPGPHTCQGIVQPPLTVRLPGRLGNRRLFDGSTYPPSSAEDTRVPGF